MPKKIECLRLQIRVSREQGVNNTVLSIFILESCESIFALYYGLILPCVLEMQTNANLVLGSGNSPGDHFSFILDERKL